MFFKRHDLTAEKGSQVGCLGSDNLLNLLCRVLASYPNLDPLQWLLEKIIVFFKVLFFLLSSPAVSLTNLLCLKTLLYSMCHSGTELNLGCSAVIITVSNRK